MLVRPIKTFHSLYNNDLAIVLTFLTKSPIPQHVVMLALPSPLEEEVKAQQEEAKQIDSENLVNITQ